MSFRPSGSRRPSASSSTTGSNLSSNPSNQSSNKPNYPSHPGASSATSQTHSNSNSAAYSTYQTRVSSPLLGRPSLDVPPPVPSKNEKRLPLPPSGTPPRRGMSNSAVGPYDNKLVGILDAVAITAITDLADADPYVPFEREAEHPQPIRGAPSRRDGADGRVLGRHRERDHCAQLAQQSVESVDGPRFAALHGQSPQDGNRGPQLCNSHIVASSSRAPASRLISLLLSDLRDFIGAGMLTLKSKFETLEESKVVSRASEVWSFFWAQILPYVEGILLPFSQLRDSTNPASISTPISVRHLLLSGFLLHIVLPLLPRLTPLVTTTGPSTFAPPTPELQRLLQMSLVLSTQARYSSFFPTHDAERRDEEARENVDNLGKAVRWRMNFVSQGGADVESPIKNPVRNSLQRGTSIARRRRGMRASQMLAPAIQPTRQSSQLLDQKWGKPLDEEDEDETTPGHSFAFQRPQAQRPGEDMSFASSGLDSGATEAASTLTVGTMRYGGADQRTPQADGGFRRDDGRTPQADGGFRRDDGGFERRLDQEREKDRRI
ncbi:hypothetical protein P7C73_g6132, partial [Tremellales sp. Uapishka_1]